LSKTGGGVRAWEGAGVERRKRRRRGRRGRRRNVMAACCSRYSE